MSLQSGAKKRCREFRIEVPWGFLCGKEWGEEAGPPVLLLHGLLHNAGSFDALLPLLPPGFCYLALDLPGHGASSHFQPGTIIHMLDFVMAVRRLVLHQKWNKLILVGHSLGAAIALFFSAIYPDFVTKLILIDGFSLPPVDPSKSTAHIRRQMDAIEEFEKHISGKSPPSYTLQEALLKILNSSFVPISERSAMNLLSRSLVQDKSEFRFSSDQRLKLAIKPLTSLDQIVNFVMSLKSSVLLILADKTFQGSKQRNELGEGYLERISQAVNHVPYFEYQVVPGNHHVHLDHPERVSPLISEFLLRPPHSSL